MRVILVIGRSNSGKLDFIKALTGSLPKGLDDEAFNNDHSGLIHKYNIRNKYFEASVGIWIEEYSNLAETLDAYSSEEAKEVIDSLGAIVYTFRSFDEAEWSLFKNFIDKLQLEIPVIGLHMSDEKLLEPPDVFTPEYISISEEGVNEFNEKVGLDRVREILDCCEWNLSQVDKSFSEEKDDAGDFYLPERFKGSPDMQSTDLDNLMKEMNQIRGW